MAISTTTKLVAVTAATLLTAGAGTTPHTPPLLPTLSDSVRLRSIL